jgi:hypothetical protein
MKEPKLRDSPEFHAIKQHNIILAWIYYISQIIFNIGLFVFALYIAISLINKNYADYVSGHIVADISGGIWLLFLAITFGLERVYRHTISIFRRNAGSDIEDILEDIRNIIKKDEKN